MKNRNNKIAFLVSCFLLCASLLYAPPLPPDPVINGPIDLGASILLAGGILYGIVQIKKFKKKK